MPIQIPAQRRWLQNVEYHGTSPGKLSPMFELRELPGYHEEAHEEVCAIQPLLAAMGLVLDKAAQLLEHDGALL